MRRTGSAYAARLTVISPRSVLLILAAFAVAAYLCLPFGPRASGPSTGNSGVVLIDVWHPWGGTTGEDFRRVVAEFNARHPGINVRAVFSPGDSSSATKFFVSVAAGVPPDVAFVDGPQVAAWAGLGLLEPLDDFFAGNHLKADDYWPPCWQQCLYRDHPWAITFVADPNFALVWNKALFREAGLDADNPPRTVAEVDALCDRLTRFDAAGNMERIGMMPWSSYGGANTVFTWGWLFGGEFFDPAQQRVTADDPANVAALEWLTRSAHRFGFERVNAFSSTFSGGAQDPFFTGRIAMAVMHLSVVLQVPTYAPGLDFGIAPLPAPPGGEYGASWVGGWTLALPRDSRHRRTPARHAAALEFLRWTCASAEGTAFASRAMKSFVGYRPCPYFDEIRQAPPGSYEATFLSPFLRILETTRHQRPVMPASARYMAELERAYSRTLYGQSTAAAALVDARTRTQTALDSLLQRAAATRSATVPPR